MLICSDQFVFTEVFDNGISNYAFHDLAQDKGKRNWSVVSWISLGTILEYGANISSTPRHNSFVARLEKNCCKAQPNPANLSWAEISLIFT